MYLYYDFCFFFFSPGPVRDDINSVVYSYVIVCEVFMQTFAEVQKFKMKRSDAHNESSQLNNIVKKTGDNRLIN
jgi:hypothetical protein